MDTIGDIPVDHEGKWLQIIGAKVIYDNKELWVHGVWDCSSYSDGRKYYYVEIQFSDKRINLTSLPGIAVNRGLTRCLKPMGWSEQAAPVGCLWYDLKILHPSPRPEIGARVRCVCCSDRGIVTYAQKSSNEWISVQWEGGNPSDCKRAGITLATDILEVAYPEII